MNKIQGGYLQPISSLVFFIYIYQKLLISISNCGLFDRRFNREMIIRFCLGFPPTDVSISDDFTGMYRFQGRWFHPSIQSSSNQISEAKLEPIVISFSFNFQSVPNFYFPMIRRAFHIF